MMPRSNNVDKYADITALFRQNIECLSLLPPPQVNSCDVRPYSDRSTKSFVTDLRDGFFPSELKEAYPDGLYIHAIDERFAGATSLWPRVWGS